MTQHTTTTATRSARAASAVSRAWTVVVTAWIAVTVATFAVAERLRGHQLVDDRGSDSTEKSLMIILAISIGAAVTAAAGIFIATKTALFK